MTSMPVPTDASRSGPRDVGNFITVRDSGRADDRVIGGLLVAAFTETYARKLPHVTTDGARVLELLNIAKRRASGRVRVLELGQRVIATYSLLAPGTPENQAWDPTAASLRCLAVDPEFHGLRLSDIMLDDAVAVARTFKAHRICLHVQQGAVGVARVYTAFGFRRDETGDSSVQGNIIEGYRLDL